MNTTAMRDIHFASLIAPLLCLVAGIAAGCSVNPVSGLPEVTLVSAKQEQEIGDEEAKKVAEQMGLLDDNQFAPYLTQLGQRLAEQSPRKDVPYQFHVVDMVEPNAFALPGGYVYVTRGLLTLVNSEDELAGVVGHETRRGPAHSTKDLAPRPVRAPHESGCGDYRIGQSAGRKHYRGSRGIRAEPRVLAI
jgi:predicted Zn-dependent protease